MAYGKWRIVAKGFTLIELVLVMGIFTAIVSLSTISLSRLQSSSRLDAAVNSLNADLREQQLKAMSGDNDGQGGSSNYNYGVHFDAESYTFFRENYGAGNISYTLKEHLEFVPPFTEFVFQKGSGEIGAPVTVTINDTAIGRQKIIEINKLGVVTDVN